MQNDDHEQVVTFTWTQTKDRENPLVATCRLPWRKNMAVRMYLHDAALRPYNLIQRWLRGGAVHFNAKGVRIKLSYIPTPGDTITLL